MLYLKYAVESVDIINKYKSKLSVQCMPSLMIQNDIALKFVYYQMEFDLWKNTMDNTGGYRKCKRTLW